MLLNVFYGIANGADVFGVLVLDLEVELLLHRHDNLDKIERVGVEIPNELGTLDNLIRLDAEPLGDDPLNPLQIRSQTGTLLDLDDARRIPCWKQATVVTSDSDSPTM